jgi:hypothetical protein
MPCVLPRILSWRRLLLIDWWRPGMAGVTLVPRFYRSCQGQLLFTKQPLEGFRHLLWLEPPAVESSAGCWCSRPFGRSRSFWPSTVETPGTSAGRWLCPWPTRIVIPMTLAPETGEVSWVSMGLRRVLFLVEVYSRPSKSQDSSSGSEIVGLEVKLRGASPAVSGRAGSETGPVLGCSIATSQGPAPGNLNRFGV